MDSRELKGLELAARARVERHRSYWSVPSSGGLGLGYKVSLDAKACTCEDYDLRKLPCKHVFAVRYVMEREAGTMPPPADESDPDTVPAKRPTYRQDWPKYNAPQTNEKRLFLELLADLCRTVEEPPRKDTGRPRIPRSDAVFAAVFKVYSTVSGRRFMTDLRDAQEKGHISRAPHYNSVFRVLEDTDITPILKRLVIRSSLPLKAVETQFACDSSGFSTSRFVRWFDQKWGVQRKKAEWVKVHAMCGVKTNVVTAVEVSDDADATLFRTLTATTAQHFTVEEVSADKAYSSYDNLEFAAGMGATPFVPFKVNARGYTRPGVWEKMFHYFSLNREEFLKHYHKRSNVESTFSMIKGKFRDHVRSKTDAAMRNEVLCKVLCHNLCCLIHEMHELGIAPEFDGQTTPEARIIRFPTAQFFRLP
jgi:transposase